MHKFNDDYFQQMVREGLVMMPEERQTIDNRPRNDLAFAFIVGLLTGIATGIMIGWGLKCLM